MAKKKQKGLLEEHPIPTLLIAILAVMLIIGLMSLYSSTIGKVQYYTNVVQYQSTNYTINQIWQEPDFCAYGINYTNGTLLWGEGWHPTRPSLPFIENISQNAYRWNLENKSLAIYQQEWNAPNGIAWACCEEQCV